MVLAVEHAAASERYDNACDKSNIKIVCLHKLRKERNILSSCSS